MLTLSVLDIVRYEDDRRIAQAIDNVRNLAVRAEGWGYSRFWVAEHHNIPGIASTATAVLVGHIAAATHTIRVGAGGIMLPNHAPFVIAEQFGTLAHMFPGRIDLGLGRSSGSDQAAMHALRRSADATVSFPRDVMELQGYFTSVGHGRAPQAIPAAGTDVPLWILGSSMFGAQLAAQSGLPFGFGSHFAPDLLVPALDAYRASFRPSAQRGGPWSMAALNVIVADNDADARKLASSQQMAFTDMLRTGCVHMRPPIDDIERYWTSAEKVQVNRMLARSVAGSPQTVREYLRAFLSETGSDELMIVSDIYDHGARLRSLELLAAIADDLTRPV